MVAEHLRAQSRQRHGQMGLLDDAMGFLGL